MAQEQAKPGKPQTIRLPLMGAYSNRGYSASKDQRFVNIFPETRKVDQIESTKIFLNKRPGLTLYKDFGTGEGRGCIYFNNKFYVAIGNTVYEDGVTPTSKITLTGSTGPISMMLANSSTIGDYLFICDGTYAWIINTTGTVTQITDTSISRILVDNGGAGYGAVPSVSISGTGSGATATANVTGGVVTSVDVTVGGSGYTGTPSITIAAPALTFNPATDVNTTNETIAITGHKYATTNAVVYNNGGGGSIGGLTSTNTYYVISVDANTIKLATSSANATAGTAVNLTSVGSGTTHTLTGTTTATATATLNSFPTPHNPSATFLDGYVILSKGSDVYNCALDTPTVWDADNFLSAEMFPDPVVALARQNNQIVVMGHSSIEFFYDAANAAGSPLSRNDSTTIQMGVAAPHCVYQNEKYCAYISQSDSGGRAVWLVEGFQPKKVSDEYIERILDAETDIKDCRGFGFRTKGHMFYLINLKTNGRTLVYDIDEKLWHEWSSNSTGNHGVFQCDYMADNSTGAAYVLHSSNGCLYKVDVDSYQDDGTAILVELVTNRYDLDSYYRKFMSSIKIVGDLYETTNNLSLQWSDNDYQTWSNVKTISLSDTFPAFHRLGAFRRRAFKLTHSSNNPLRLESLEAVYTVGSS